MRPFLLGAKMIGYSIKAKADKEAEIFIYEEIGEGWYGGISAKKFADDLKALGEIAKITLRINSPGGDVFDGNTIYNILKQHKASVVVYIDGLAASIASIIAMAGDEIFIADNAMVMVHNPSTFAVGYADDLRKTADLLDKIAGSIVVTYVKRTGQDEAKIKELMANETWMSAQEALQNGFADQIVDAVPAAAHFDLSKFQYRNHPKNSAIALAASGRVRNSANVQNNPPGVSGLKLKGNNCMKPIAEQIASFEAKRQANVARMEAIRVLSADEGRSMNEQEGQEFDGLDIENNAIDKDLVRLRKLENQVVASATKITPQSVEDPIAASNTRSGASIVKVQGPALPKGTAFIRYAQALAASFYASGHVDRTAALEIARANRGWKDQTPQVERILASPNFWRIQGKAVAGGTTTADGWATELADYTWMASEFIDYLRPQTIIGRIQGLRRVPFNIKMPLQDSGASVGWVGEAARKPITKLTFDTTTLRYHKAAGICVVSEELVRFSNPSIEALIRDDLTKSMRQFLDEQFIDPSVAVSGDISPASITNGAGTAGAAGTSAANFRTDLKAALTAIVADNIDPNRVVIIMLPIQALAMSQMVNALGLKEFPDININGGTLEGFPVITSASVASGNVVFLVPGEVMLAEEEGAAVDVSRETSLVMDDGGSPTVTAMVSMFQTNQVAIRVEQYITWKRRRDEAVYVKTSCAYV
jgi:HK97 family phage major capsid protein/ATP-dependent Clp endopeptidase proteolytic subunit ClpP